MEGWVMALLTRVHGVSLKIRTTRNAETTLAWADWLTEPGLPLQWSYEEVQNYRAQLLGGLKSRDIKAWHDVCVTLVSLPCKIGLTEASRVVYARKPG